MAPSGQIYRRGCIFHFYFLVKISVCES